VTTPPPGWNPPPGWQPPPAWGPPPPGWQPPAEDTTLAVLAHLSIFAFGLIGPLVIYLVKRDESPFTRHHAAEALNFHITLAIAVVVSLVLILVLVGVFLLLALAIAGPVLGILAALAASRREAYRYPLTIRFVH
jgi:uncharacterized Tic20 family protein